MGDMDVRLLLILGFVGMLGALIMRARLRRRNRPPEYLAEARRQEAIRRLRSGDDAGGTAGDMGGRD
jgi:hypothetical protein